MVLFLGKKAHVRVSSGEAESPAIAPCPLIAVGKGKREAGQEKEYKRILLTLLGPLRWAQVDVPAPRAPGRAGAQHSRTWLCISPDPLSQPWERSLAAPRALPQLPAMVQGLPHIRDLCTIQGAAAPYHSRFPLCSSMLSLLSSQTTQTSCFTHTSALFISQSPGRERE